MLLETTFSPVFITSAFLASPAIFPPCFAAILFSTNPLGFWVLTIAVVEASPSIEKINSSSHMISQIFAF